MGLEVTAADLAYGKAQEIDPRLSKFDPPDPNSIPRGFAAESVFARYIAAHTWMPFRWIKWNGYQEPDFIINLTGADLKTGCRKGRPMRHHYVGVNAQQFPYLKHPAFCFGSYDTSADPPIAWFLGGIDRVLFTRLAKLCRKGEVGNLRDDGTPFILTADMYRIPIEDNLTPPLEWIRELERRRY